MNRCKYPYTVLTSYTLLPSLVASFAHRLFRSSQTQSIIDTCDEYGMGMCMTGVRLFHH